MNAQPFVSLLFFLLALCLAPLLSGIINRVKAHMGGRTGRPLLQLYYDIRKLLRKSPVYPAATTWVFQAAPMAVAATGAAALVFVPFGGFASLFSFTGDFLLLAGLFALGRFAMMLGALDTGSPFEGMGAAREALFSAMAEPVFLLCMAILAYGSGSFSLTGMIGASALPAWADRWPFLLLLAGAFFLLLLTENSRIPVDDPNTHLELTMIHEVMVLDHSGPDLALVEYGSALKLWVFCQVIAGVLLPLLDLSRLFPAGGQILAGLCNAGASLLVIFLLAVLVGLVESLMARLRMERVPQVLTLAGAFTGLAALSLWR